MKRLICASSSMMRTVLVGLRIGFGCRGDRNIVANRKADRNGGSMSGAGPFPRNGAAVRNDENPRDPETEPEAWNVADMAPAAHRAPEQLARLLARQSHPLIGHGEYHMLALGPRHDRDVGTGGRIFGGIFD